MSWNRRRLLCLIPLVLMLGLSTVGAQNAGTGDSGFESSGDAIRFGLQVAVVGMAAVFTGLVAVYFAMVGLRKLIQTQSLKRVRLSNPGLPVDQKPVEVTSEVAHAIALALFMDLRTFDEEMAAEITIKKITRPYSPWWNSGKMALMYDKMEIFRK